MKDKVDIFNDKNTLYSKNDKLLLAVSGGLDSMAMVDYYVEKKANIVVAHCNFGLRGEESDGDALFVEKKCRIKNIEFVSIQFNTNLYAIDNKLSIQEAARVLRYDWLEKVRKEKKCEYIVTAHHLDDNIETLLYNLIKGTGMVGLRGMLPKNGKLIRPFLSVNRVEIETYAIDNGVEYREDSSNASTKYSRNKIRHNIMPSFKEINPNLTKTMSSHFDRFLSIDALYDSAIDLLKDKLVEERGSDKYVAIRKLQKINGYTSLLFEIVREYGFNAQQVEDIIASLGERETKVFYAENCRIIKDRRYLIITPLQNTESSIFLVEKKTKRLNLPNRKILKIHLKPYQKLTRISKQAKYAYLDADKLVFPLTIRTWSKGDYFYPFGLYSEKGRAKKKKISQFFKDQKMSLVDKENTWLLISGEKVVAILGYRSDDRFKVTDNTCQVLQLECL